MGSPLVADDVSNRGKQARSSASGAPPDPVVQGFITPTARPRGRAVVGEVALPRPASTTGAETQPTPMRSLAATESDRGLPPRPCHPRLLCWPPLVEARQRNVARRRGRRAKWRWGALLLAGSHSAQNKATPNCFCYAKYPVWCPHPSNTVLSARCGIPNHFDILLSDFVYSARSGILNSQEGQATFPKLQAIVFLCSSGFLHCSMNRVMPGGKRDGARTFGWFCGLAVAARSEGLEGCAVQGTQGKKNGLYQSGSTKN